MESNCTLGRIPVTNDSQMAIVTTAIMRDYLRCAVSEFDSMVSNRSSEKATRERLQLIKRVSVQIIILRGVSL